MEPEGADKQKSPIGVPLGRRLTLQGLEDGDTGDCCRICRGEAIAEQPLFFPCKCSGSIKYVHQECLMEWLSHTQKKYCELCKTSFRFTKLYDQSMPDAIPIPLFLRHLILYGARSLGRWFRYATVILIWTCCLPWAIRQVWRGLFWLADGSWMSENDLYQLLSTHGNAAMLDQSRNTTMLSESTTATPTVSLPSFSPISILISVVTGDALLRGLLRLVTYKAFSSSSLLPAGNGTDAVYVPTTNNLRRSSIFSNARSLNSLTKHSSVNNALIDVLEGQIICICVITAFVLVFLIREWVINQQPVHLMPDPDHGDIPIVQANQNDEAQNVAPRRRPDARRPFEPHGLADNRGTDIGQRPLANPRPRRGVPLETNEDAIRLEGQELRSDRPPRSDSLSNLTMTREHANGSFRGQNFHAQPSTSVAADLHVPLLQRGIFDEAADIRRAIEENPDLRSHDQTLFLTQRSEPGQPHHGEHHGFEEIRDATTPFDFSALSQQNGSSEFTFTSTTSFDIGSLHDTNEETRSESRLSSTSATAPSRPASSHSPSEPDLTVTTPTVIPPSTPGTALEVDHLAHAGANASSTEDSNGMLECVAKWLWPDDQTETPPTPLSLPDAQLLEDLDGETDMTSTEVEIPAQEAIVATRAVPAEAAAPAPIIAAVPNPPPIPAQVHDADVQFGIDLNDQIAIDDAEDLEGVLELIGMEGPIAGMIQNIIFSLFLITLTLSASVWCPYIWGKIALLVMSNPIGVFFKAPLFFLSRIADFMVDVALLAFGLLGLVFTNVTRSARFIIRLLFPEIAKYIRINAAESLAINVTKSSTTRLEKVLSMTVFHLRPDLPTFSMQSHYALRIFKGATLEIYTAIQNYVVNTWKDSVNLWSTDGIKSLLPIIFNELATFPAASFSALQEVSAWFNNLSDALTMPAFHDADSIDISLMEWNTPDKVLTTMLGYIFFALAGATYLKLARYFMTVKDDQKVEGILADSLRQAGGVMKVIIIIGIEMIAFPLYCGWLFDIASLPLFEKATIHNRLTFLATAPITALFVHWFIGTCYMFHFALFVSMCRKILRRGVLYFIRDPDDPNFHPVRDVLERPVFTQLSKIAFSACVYGALLLLCLGGVVWTVGRIDGIFPIHWATSEPRLAFPIDVIFFNFLLPILIRTAEPSKKISSAFAWWFTVCSKQLRLSHFLFDIEVEDEVNAKPWFWYRNGERASMQADTQGGGSDRPKANDTLQAGRWVRAPASDAARIPRGSKVFLEVDVNNERLDGLPDRDKGVHGKNDERFKKIFIPSNFRLRIATFIFLVWLFAAVTGVTCTLGPLAIGRITLKTLSGSASAPNDLYAFTVGLHLTGLLLVTTKLLRRYFSRLKQDGIDLLSKWPAILPYWVTKIRYALGLLYLGVTFGVVIPMLLSLLAELYVHMPFYDFLASSAYISRRSTYPTAEMETNTAASSHSSHPLSPKIYLVQSWTLGILYLRLLARACFRYASGRTRLAITMRSVMQGGLLRPKVLLVSRGLVLPLVVLSIALLTIPLALAKCYIAVTGISDGTAMLVYRYSYPTLLLIALSCYAIIQLKYKIERWQMRVRDEIFLVGERLHNFVDESSPKVLPHALKVDKGKAKETDIVPDLAHFTDQNDLGAGSGFERETVSVHQRTRASGDAVIDGNHDIVD